MDENFFILVMYRRLGQWRWRAVARNNRRLANSGEGYRNKADCHHALDLLFPGQHITFKTDLLNP